MHVTAARTRQLSRSQVAFKLHLDCLQGSGRNHCGDSGASLIACLRISAREGRTSLSPQEQARDAPTPYDKSRRVLYANSTTCLGLWGDFTPVGNGAKNSLSHQCFRRQPLLFESPRRSCSHATRPTLREAQIGYFLVVAQHFAVDSGDKPVSTSLRLLIVLNVLFKYASAR